jgi:hypothetical protein
LVFEKTHFSLYKIAVQGVSLWHIHIYMYYSLNWFMWFWKLACIFNINTLSKREVIWNSLCFSSLCGEGWQS